MRWILYRRLLGFRLRLLKMIFSAKNHAKVGPQCRDVRQYEVVHSQYLAKYEAHCVSASG